MASSVFTPEYCSEQLSSSQDGNPWYVVRVRSHFEVTVATALCGKGYESYLPTYRKHSSRGRNVELPLFPGYVFCRFSITSRLPVLTTPGVVSLVRFGKDFIPVPKVEMDGIRSIVKSGLPSMPWPHLQEGDRVRVLRGPLAGVEGVLAGLRNDPRIVVSVSMLNRGVAVEIDRNWVEPVRAANVCEPRRNEFHLTDFQ